MASTFDPDLIHQVGVFLAEEAKIKSSVILLAPTCNIQRNPLGGRAFESFSEDPHLSGMFPVCRSPASFAYLPQGTLAAAYVNGFAADPGCLFMRRVRSNCERVKSEPPTSARIPPVPGSTLSSAACSGFLRRRYP